MRVKIGDTWYSSDDQPICIQLTKAEQKDICSMYRCILVQGKYAVFPDNNNMTVEERREFMKG